MRAGISVKTGGRRAWVSDALDVDPEEILASLERGYPVRLIGTFEALVTCTIDDKLDYVLNRAHSRGFDFLPVRDGEKVVGVFDSRPFATGDASSSKRIATRVCDAFDRLDESNIIAADAGILVFLSKARTSPCRLILTGDQVTGIVCKSDLQKLPVRALLFHLVTHLELVVAEWIRQNVPDESSWLSVLSDYRRNCVEKRYESLARANLAIDRLTAAMFCDKRTVLVKFGTHDKSNRQVEAELKRIEHLRNSLAHSGAYALTEDAADGMIETVALAQSWIRTIPGLLPKPKA